MPSFNHHAKILQRSGPEVLQVPFNWIWREMASSEYRDMLNENIIRKAKDLRLFGKGQRFVTQREKYTSELVW